MSKEKRIAGMVVDADPQGRINPVGNPTDTLVPGELEKGKGQDKGKDRD
jgi:hypothetical protein